LATAKMVVAGLLP